MKASAPPVVSMLVVWMLSLSAIGIPCKRAAYPAFRALDVEPVRLENREPIDRDHPVESAFVRPNPFQVHLHELLRVDAVRLERKLNLGDGRLDDLEAGRFVAVAARSLSLSLSLGAAFTRGTSSNKRNGSRFIAQSSFVCYRRAETGIRRRDDCDQGEKASIR